MVAPELVVGIHGMGPWCRNRNPVICLDRKGLTAEIPWITHDSSDHTTPTRARWFSPKKSRVLASAGVGIVLGLWAATATCAAPSKTTMLAFALPPPCTAPQTAVPELSTERRTVASARRLATTRWSQPKQVTLARRVSVLDRFLGGSVSVVRDLLVVQSVILSRQECARRAIEASRSPSPGCVAWQVPNYLINPLQELTCWPLPYADTPNF